MDVNRQMYVFGLSCFDPLLVIEAQVDLTELW